jgi:hypothetical protein
MHAELKHFAVALVGAILLGATMVGASALVGQRRGGFVTLTLTPAIIGDNTSREEVVIEVDETSVNPAFCCWGTGCTPNRTPGADTGTFRKGAGRGAVVCKYPDQVLRCISAGANLSYDQAFVRTATATATGTATATP